MKAIVELTVLRVYCNLIARMAPNFVERRFHGERGKKRLCKNSFKNPLGEHVVVFTKKKRVLKVENQC